MSELLALIKADLRRYTYRFGNSAISVILLVPGFQAVAVYRISHAFQKSIQRKWLIRYPIIIFDLVLRRISEIMTGIYIVPNAEIGPGLFIPHFGGIVIGAVHMGSNCEIFQGVTLGRSTIKGGLATFGDRVYIGPGAKIFGDITIGNDVRIGANAVVTKSVPDRAVMVGIPARLISQKGSFDLVSYPGMDTDPQRLISLAAVNQNFQPPINQLSEQ